MRRIPTRHCEERSDVAIQLRAKARQKMHTTSVANAVFAFFRTPAGAQLDCFASLAMTVGAHA
jgi:hypothetical protein